MSELERIELEAKRAAALAAAEVYERALAGRVPASAPAALPSNAPKAPRRRPSRPAVHVELSDTDRARAQRTAREMGIPVLGRV